MYKITDYFSQKCRVKCVFNPLKDSKAGKNMLEQYSDIKDDLFKKLGILFHIINLMIIYIQRENLENVVIFIQQ